MIRFWTGSPLVFTSLENALVPSPDLDRRPRPISLRGTIQRPPAARPADERGPDEEPDEAGMLDHEARELCCPERRRARSAGRTGSPHAPLTRASTCK